MRRRALVAVGSAGSCGHTPAMPTPRALRRVSVVLALCFVALSAQVATFGEVPGERRLLEGVVELSTDRGDRAARLVDRATGTLPLAAATVLLAVALVRRGRRAAALAVVVSVGGALAGNPLLKQLLDRPRPELLASLEGASPFAFPSGHAAGTAALAAAAVLAASSARRAVAGDGGRAAGTLVAGTPVAGGIPVVVGIPVVGLLAVGVTAAAQLVLARHFPSDVLAGWLWASAWTCAVWGRLRPGPPGGR